MNLTLLNFNTQGTPFFAKNTYRRYQKMAEIINKENPDIICFQEISTYYHLFLLKKFLKYPFFVYQKFFHGPKGGLVIVSKLPIEKMEFKHFENLGSLKSISFFAHIIKNGLLIIHLKDKPVAIINTHTFSDFEFDWSQTNKLYHNVKAEVEQTAKAINALVNKKKTVIIAGDFNMKKGSTLYANFIKQTSATDVFAHDSTPTYFNDRLHYKFKGKSSERIDFVFYKEGETKTKPLTHEYFFNQEYSLNNNKQSYLSDHIGLQVKFAIN